MPLDRWHLDQIVIPRLTKDRWRFITNSRVEANERAKERAQAGLNAKKDFFHYLLNAKDPETGEGLTTQELWGESNMLMLAGSDTTSTTLSATIFYLLHNLRNMEQLKSEVRENFNNVEEIVTGPQLNSLVYLKACIDEAMRLAPSLPAAIPREVTDGGLEVDGVFLPEGTDCGTSAYSIHRHPDYYREPLSYIPERWIAGATCQTAQSSWTSSKADVETARRAFCPFSIGPRACIGKSMAILELRLILARIMFLFDLEFADQTGNDGTGHFALIDHFAAAKDGPSVTIRKRVLA
jgi:cytochrome P450